MVNKFNEGFPINSGVTRGNRNIQSNLIDSMCASACLPLPHVTEFRRLIFRLQANNSAGIDNTFLYVLKEV